MKNDNAEQGTEHLKKDNSENNECANDDSGKGKHGKGQIRTGKIWKLIISKMKTCVPLFLK